MRSTQIPIRSHLFLIYENQVKLLPLVFNENSTYVRPWVLTPGARPATLAGAKCLPVNAAYSVCSTRVVFPPVTFASISIAPFAYPSWMAFAPKFIPSWDVGNAGSLVTGVSISTGLKNNIFKRNLDKSCSMTWKSLSYYCLYWRLWCREC